jgi:25S rRNA (cytosine2278-C5)-methyltransferase
MSLYHEAAAVLTAAVQEGGGGLRSRVFNNRSLQSPASQVYALAFEACKWSGILKEVIEKAALLPAERKVSSANFSLSQRRLT